MDGTFLFDTIWVIDANKPDIASFPTFIHKVLQKLTQNDAVLRQPLQGCQDNSRKLGDSWCITGREQALPHPPHATAEVRNTFSYSRRDFERSHILLFEMSWGKYWTYIFLGRSSLWRFDNTVEFPSKLEKYPKNEQFHNTAASRSMESEQDFCSRRRSIVLQNDVWQIISKISVTTVWYVTDAMLSDHYTYTNGLGKAITSKYCGKRKERFQTVGIKDCKPLPGHDVASPWEIHGSDVHRYPEWRIDSSNGQPFLRHVPLTASINSRTFYVCEDFTYFPFHIEDKEPFFDLLFFSAERPIKFCT